VNELLRASGLSDQGAMEALSSFLKKRDLAAGELLFDYGDSTVEEMFFLSHGHLAVHKKTGFQEKMQVIALLDPGAVVGEGALLDGHIRATRVRAIKDSSLLALSRSDFAVFQHQHPLSALLFLEFLLGIVSLRLEKTSERLARIL